jgi:hypothetical protein
MVFHTRHQAISYTVKSNGIVTDSSTRYFHHYLELQLAVLHLCVMALVQVVHSCNVLRKNSLRTKNESVHFPFR